MQPRAHTKPIRVALVITELHVGGAERCLVNLATGLDPRRFAPMVYSLMPPPTDRRALVDQLEVAGIPVDFLDARSQRELLSTRLRLRRRLARQEPDVVQCFLFHANVMGCWAAPRSAVVVGGIRVADPRRGRLWMERQALRRAEKIVCVSRSVARFARTAARLPRDRLIVIPNGIDEARFLPAQPADLAEFGIQPNDPVVLFIGRLERQKGVDWLLSHAAPLLGLTANMHLLLVGAGPLEPALRYQAAQLECQARIHFAGRRDDIASLLKRAQLLVLPSRWEGMPNVVLEAMACGVPVVAARADGVEELLGSDSAQIVEFGDGDSLLRAVQELLSDPDLAAEVRHQNRQRVRESFSLARMVEQYEQLYAVLVAGRSE